MSLTAKWDKGVSVSYDGFSLFFDLQTNHHSALDVFITHAHLDHSRAFSFAGARKYSTSETCEIIKAVSKMSGNCVPVGFNQKLKLGDLEVISHNSGHVLGSALYEVVSPDATVVYTGDLNFENTYTMKAAEGVHCNVLIIEATFGSPHFVFPPKEELAYRMSRWAVESVLDHKTPVFQTDSFGNAQEIIHIVNSFTKLPVLTHWRISRINSVYESHGYKLDYVDSGSEEAEEIMSSGEYAYIVPKGLSLSGNPRFDVAFVSGWAIWNRDERQAFAYSDHADYPKLMDFVEECNPETVLTCFGGRFNNILAREIKRHLNIEAYPLELISTTYISK